MVSAALQKSCGKIHAFVRSHGRLPQRKDAVEGGDTLARNLARLRSETWPVLTAEEKMSLLAEFPLLRRGLESDDMEHVNVTAATRAALQDAQAFREEHARLPRRGRRHVAGGED